MMAIYDRAHGAKMSLRVSDDMDKGDVMKERNLRDAQYNKQEEKRKKKKKTGHTPCHNVR